jgi:hypothetical protein
MNAALSARTDLLWTMEALFKGPWNVSEAKVEASLAPRAHSAPCRRLQRLYTPR